MSGDFNPQRARAKRPCPLWVDAFQRDTQHLEADEVGAYMLILMAMWTRETCDFPDDDRRLKSVARVSSQKWKRRIGPILREFFTTSDGYLTSPRLKKEAIFVEKSVTAQSEKKSGKKSDKTLKNNDVGQSADTSTDVTADAPPDEPTQQPNNLLITLPNGSDADGVSDRDFLWEFGVPWLVGRHVPEKRAREMIGKWLSRASSAADVRDAFRQAQIARTEDPIPYITEILKPPPDISQVVGDAVKGLRA